LEEIITLSPKTRREGVMRSNRNANPHQLAMLTSTLEEFCSAQHIEPFSPGHEHAAMLMMALFNHGAQSEGALVIALAQWTKREAMRVLPEGMAA
jgi:hypothetical protein